jgi:hypothetical protein
VIASSTKVPLKIDSLSDNFSVVTPRRSNIKIVENESDGKKPQD